MQDSAKLKTTEVNFIELEPYIQLGSNNNLSFDTIIFKEVRFDTASVGVTNRFSFLSDKTSLNMYTPSID